MESGKQKDPSLHFLGGMDVRAQAEDLGNDHVIVNTQGIENLKYLCEHPDVWNVTDKTSLYVLQGRYEAVLNHYKQWVQHVCRIWVENVLLKPIIRIFIYRKG